MKRFIGGLRRVVERIVPDVVSLSCEKMHLVGKPQTENRIATLDSLRGFVAFIVVVHHIWTIFNAEVHAQISGTTLAVLDLVQAQNHRAVMAFFVLSGFTISLTTQDRRPISWSATCDYLRRRLRRILPLYYFSLAWTAALGITFGMAERNFAISTLLGNLVFLQTSATAHGTWFVPFGGNGPYWSLSYEMSYYLALPLALFVATARSDPFRSFSDTIRLRLIMLGLAASVIGLVTLSLAPNPFSMFATFWIVWIAGFCAHGLEPKTRSALLLALPATGSWLCVGLLALAGRHSDTLVSAAEGTLIAFLFGALVAWRGWATPRFMHVLDRAFNMAFARIGRGSYALYLLHYPLLVSLNRLLIGGDGGIFAWAAATVVMFVFITQFCPFIEDIALQIFRPQRVPQAV